MNFSYKDFKRLPFDIVCLFCISFFYLFLSNIFLIDHFSVLYLTPLVFSVYLKNHFKLLFFEFYLFIFGFLSDILSKKMLGMTSFLNLIVFYIFVHLNKKANNAQSFIYSVCILIIYMIYDALIYKYGFYFYNEIITQKYELYLLIFCLNFIMILYIYLFYFFNKKNQKKLLKL